MYKEKNIIKPLFIIVIVILFFFWSKSLLISAVLCGVIDSFTTKKIAKLLKNHLPLSFYKTIKYCYIILFPFVFAIFFKMFFFEIYIVPSISMEKTLFPNDYVLVNKICYSVKLPKHLRNVPVIGQFFKPPENTFDLYTPLKPFNKFKREDIVVFKAVDSSDKLLIKRIIGLPNDVIQVIGGKVHINSKILQELENYTYNYLYRNKHNLALFKSFSNSEFSNKSPKEKEKNIKYIENKPKKDYHLFPAIKQEYWTRDNYGELKIPRKKMKIELTKENIAIYNSIALKFENVDLKKISSKFYEFKKNYYFMMGDNRHNSIDSRSFGFIPESYIQGKMIRVFSRR